MIPKNVRDGAVMQNLNGETRAFSIKANGKAFRALIDGLYSNKVRSVIRELCSNAHDSHIDAGQTIPFKVSIPTQLDPTFRVRDYGTSLSHDNVMVLYTTLFESSKETTNEQTGMLGLGSKSPFAYTDSFSVIAYDGSEKRVYLAYLETDGVPSITHVTTSPSSEPRGLEVSFPAKREDIRNFTKEMQFVAMGYSTPPTVDGMDLRIPEPRMKGNGWAIYPKSAFGSEFQNSHFIRQGSAVYPTDQSFPHVGYQWLTIVEIPIGTAEVTTSREALSYDDETSRVIREVRGVAYQELKAQVDAERAKLTTRIEHARFYGQYNNILDNLKGSTFVHFERDDHEFVCTAQNLPRGTRLPGEELERADHFGKAANARRVYNRFMTSIEVDNIDRLRVLVLDHEVKTVRRTKRIRNAGGYVLNVHDPIERKEAVAWLKQILELRDDQITLVSDLPDCPPDPRTVQRKPSMKRVLNPGQLWMSRWEGRIQSSIYGISDRGLHEWPRALAQAAKAAGVALVWDDIFWVTQKQEEAFRKKGQLPDDQRVDTYVKLRLEEAVAKAPLDQAQVLTAVTQMVGSYNKAFPVVMEQFFPDITITEAQANDVLEMAALAKIKLQDRPIAAKIEAKINGLVSKYPLLFQRSDRSHFEHYVKAVRAADALTK
jgi:hypothetical protein